ncbi:MAG: hypothetical protein ACRDL7_14720, partial [Gaiellaceae bacterium]
TLVITLPPFSFFDQDAVAELRQREFAMYRLYGCCTRGVSSCSTGSKYGHHLAHCAAPTGASEMRESPSSVRCIAAKGRREIDTQMQILSPTAGGYRTLLEFKTHADSGEMPGAAVTMGLAPRPKVE